MASTIILSDNGVSSGSAGIKTTGGNDGTLALQTTTAGGAATTAVTIDTSQNVGIGTSSPASKLDIEQTQAASTALSGLLTAVTNSSAGISSTFRVDLTPSATPIVNLVARAGGATTASSMGFVYRNGGGTETEAMRIDTSGNLLVGCTSLTSFTSRLNLSYNSGTTCWAVGPWVSTPTNFYISANAGVQGVYLNGATATSWTGWSDERIKEDLQPIENAAAKVCTLRSVTGVFKEDDTKTRKSFLIAQDVLAVLPEAVDTSNPERFGLSYTDTIPLLVAAIKEQQALITTLTERITALEAK